MLFQPGHLRDNEAVRPNRADHAAVVECDRPLRLGVGERADAVGSRLCGVGARCRIVCRAAPV